MILSNDEIQELIHKNPKTFTTILKHQHPDTYSTIVNYVSFGKTFSEKVYCYINSIQINTCTEGNIKKFTSINTGYSFCGKPSVCKCCKESVSTSCKTTLATRTREEQEDINKKREQTWLALSGGQYNNAGQSPKAIATRKEFFGDPVTRQIYIDKCEATCIERYGVKNVNQRNPYIKLLQDKSEALRLFNEANQDVAKMCNKFDLHEKTVRGYLLSHEIITKGRSIPEQEIYDYLISLGIDKTEIILGDRTLLGNKQEVDIYLPKYNFAIEYNGIHWHSEAFYNPRIDSKYHYNKTKLAQEKGVHLIQIYCFQWASQKDLIKSRIKSKLGLATKVFARKCTVKEINFAEYSRLLNKVHIQGTATSSVKLGLFYNDELIAVAGFSKTRSIIGKKKTDTEHTYELIRYASIGNVVGGASKLLKYFIKQYSPEVIRTYSDNMWNTGKLYTSIGFLYVGETKPGYWYVKKNTNKMLHRSNFTKKKLIAQGHHAQLTERDIMSSLNYYKIWDCGHKIWEYRVK